MGGAGSWRDSSDGNVDCRGGGRGLGRAKDGSICPREVLFTGVSWGWAGMFWGGRVLVARRGAIEAWDNPPNLFPEEGTRRSGGVVRRRIGTGGARVSAPVVRNRSERPRAWVRDHREWIPPKRRIRKRRVGFLAEGLGRRGRGQTDQPPVGGRGLFSGVIGSGGPKGAWRADGRWRRARRPPRQPETAVATRNKMPATSDHTPHFPLHSGPVRRNWRWPTVP